MTNSIRHSIEVLCPGISSSQVDLICSILQHKRPLVEHGKLPKADFSFPVVSPKSPGRESLNTIATLLQELCEQNGYAAVASTQVGITLPFVWFARGLILVQRPKFRRVGSGNVYALEGCGSLPTGNMYLTSYPSRVVLTYNCHGYDITEDLNVAPWFPSTVSLRQGFSVTNYMHETLHLDGKTSASGRLVDPRTVSEEDWDVFFEAFQTVLDPGFVRRLLSACGGEGRRPRTVFKEYLLRNTRATQFLLPGLFGLIGKYRSVPLGEVV